MFVDARSTCLQLLELDSTVACIFFFHHSNDAPHSTASVFSECFSGIKIKDSTCKARGDAC